MSALYRRYRPMRFSEIIGQEAIAQTLKNQVAAGRISHAYLFTGMRGTGKTSLARILAKAVNCRNPADGEPCGICDICVGIDEGAVLDVSEIDAASNNGVDSIRELREEAQFFPVIADHRVYIIDEVHMLSAGAWAALLKVMEEPPSHVIFILATTEIYKVPATILSRCQRFDLRRIETDAIAAHLMQIAKQESIPLQEDAAFFIARLADGAMRDALSILDTCRIGAQQVDLALVRGFFGGIDADTLFSFAEELARHDTLSVLRRLEDLYQSALSPAGIATDLLSHFRNLLLTKIGGEEMLSHFSAEDKRAFAANAKLFTKEHLLLAMKKLRELLASLPTSHDKRLSLELCCILLSEPQFGEQAPPQQGADKKGATRAPHKISAADEAPPVDGVPPRVELQKSVGATLPEHDPSYVPFEAWDQVVHAMQKKNPLLYGFMQGSGAYLTKTHLLIDCSESFKEQLREKKEYGDIIKEIVAEQTGIYLPIGPYKRPETTFATDDPADQLIKTAESLNIPVKLK